MALNLLCIGDIHLGKDPGSLSQAVRDSYRSELAAIGPERAWEDAIDVAIDRSVDAVLLLGDVVHEEQDQWRVAGIVERGVRRLEAEGIRVVTVVGNHDAIALPRLARTMPALEIIGAEGRWEHVPIRGRHDSGLGANLIGWSFPASSFSGNPLAGIDSVIGLVDPALPTIGLLHCDLDQTVSSYAPVSRTALAAVSEVDAWLLGHVHTASFDELALERPIGYLGSLSPLKRNDCLPHGAWLLACEGTRCSMELVTSAPLRFDVVAVDVTSLRSVDELMPLVRSGIIAHLRSLPPGAIEVFGARVRLHGRSPMLRDLQAVSDELIAEYHFQFGEITCYVADCARSIRPDLDLEALAGLSSAAGLLARDILVLERSAEGWEEIVADALASAEGTIRGLGDDRDLPGAEELRSRLVRSGLHALDVLLSTGGEQIAP